MKSYRKTVGQTVFTRLQIRARCEVPAHVASKAHTVISDICCYNVTDVSRSVSYHTRSWEKKKKKKLKPRLFSKDQNFFVVGGNAGSFHENICIESFLFYFILINMFSSNSNAFFVG